MLRNWILFVVAGAFIFEAVKATARIVNSWRTMTVIRAQRASERLNDPPLFAIVVPCLEEQGVIEATLKHMALLDYPRALLRLVPVTTSSEITRAGEASTLDVVSGVAREINAQCDDRIVRPIHVPYRTKYMADQVNYAARYLFEAFDEGVNPRRVYLAIYNADSRPQKNTLMVAAQVIGATDAAVLQQPSCYVLPVGRPEHNFFRRSLLQATSLWQTRWAYAVEFPRWKSFSEEQGQCFLGYHYLVGHGLFVRLREFVEHNYLPRSYNEDAAYGTLHYLARTRIEVVPTLDTAEVPVGIRDVLIQQTQWAFGPINILRHVGYALRIIDTSSTRTLHCVLSAWWDVAAWLGGPAILFLASVLAITTNSWFRFFFFVSALTYLWMPTLVGWSCMPRDVRPPWRTAFSACLMMPVFYLIHGVGAALALAGSALGQSSHTYVPQKSRRTRSERALRIFGARK